MDTSLSCGCCRTASSRRPARWRASNFVDLAWRHDPRTGRFILFSALDNIVKGAAGQAVQCFNLMTGWPETTAL